MVISYILHDFESDPEEEMGLFNFIKQQSLGKQSPEPTRDSPSARKISKSLDKAEAFSKRSSSSSVESAPPSYTSYHHSRVSPTSKSRNGKQYASGKSSRSSSTLAGSDRQSIAQTRNGSAIPSKESKFTEKNHRGRRHHRVKGNPRRRRSASTSSSSSSSSSDSSNSNHSYRNKLKRYIGRK